MTGGSSYLARRVWSLLSRDGGSGVGFRKSAQTEGFVVMTDKNLGRANPAESRVGDPESGVTFMELMAVCVVISLLVAIIIPRIDTAMRAGRRHSAAAQF